MEPLDDHFDANRWVQLLHSVGFAIEGMQEFFQMPDGRGSVEQAALLSISERRGAHIGIYGHSRAALVWIERGRNAL